MATVEDVTGPPATTTTVFLVRHGRTALNAAGLLRGLADVELDATGRQEARSLGQLFEHVELAQVVTSPLQRAHATGAAVAATTGAAISVDDRLRDRDYGAWTSRSMDDLMAEFADPDEAPGVEPAGAVVSRALAALQDAAAAYAGKAMALVAHDVVNRLMLSRLSGLRPADVPQPTACWNRLVLVEGNWEVQVMGALPGDGSVP
jgi:probable phosphoglycerate mutase